MNEVFHNQDDVAFVDEGWLHFLKARAHQSPLQRSRLCLHRSPHDLVQEMIIVMCREVLFRPHRHRAKSESFHMIEGLIDVILFSEDGTPEQVIHMSPLGGGGKFCYRLCASQFHAVLPRTDIVVVHETTTGPWVQDGAEFAPWAPVEPDALRAFLEEGAARGRVANHNSEHFHT